MLVCGSPRYSTEVKLSLSPIPPHFPGRMYLCRLGTYLLMPMASPWRVPSILEASILPHLKWRKVSGRDKDNQISNRHNCIRDPMLPLHFIAYAVRFYSVQDINYKAEWAFDFAVINGLNCELIQRESRVNPIASQGIKTPDCLKDFMHNLFKGAKNDHFCFTYAINYDFSVAWELVSIHSNDILLLSFYPADVLNSD